MITPSLIFEVTNECNLNCVFCYNKKRRANTYISPGLFEKTLNKFKPLFLQLTGGEITTHPNLREILAIGKNNSIKMQISTNGVALENIIKSIAEYKNKPIISISLDAANEDHDKIRNSQGLFNNIVTCIKKNKKNHIHFAFNATIFPGNIFPFLPNGNIQHVPNLIELAEELKVPINFQPYAPANKSVRSKLGMILLKSHSPFILNTLPYRTMLIDNHYIRCRFSWTNKSININGDEIPVHKNNCYFCNDCKKCYYSCVWEPSLLTSQYFFMSIISFLFRGNLPQVMKKFLLRRYE